MSTFACLNRQTNERCEVWVDSETGGSPLPCSRYRSDTEVFQRSCTLYWEWPWNWDLESRCKTWIFPAGSNKRVIEKVYPVDRIPCKLPNSRVSSLALNSLTDTCTSYGIVLTIRIRGQWIRAMIPTCVVHRQDKTPSCRDLQRIPSSITRLLCWSFILLFLLIFVYSQWSSRLLVRLTVVIV